MRGSVRTSRARTTEWQATSPQGPPLVASSALDLLVRSEGRLGEIPRTRPWGVGGPGRNQRWVAEAGVGCRLLEQALEPLDEGEWSTMS